MISLNGHRLYPILAKGIFVCNVYPFDDDWVPYLFTSRHHHEEVISWLLKSQLANPNEAI